MQELKCTAASGVYPIQIGFNIIADQLAWLNGQAVLVVCDSNLTDAVCTRIPQLQPQQILSLSAGEPNKAWHQYLTVVDFLQQARALRDHTLISVGGGVIGDLVGFVAGTYMRGIPWVQVPTTLLAQVDASVGGKTAINYEGEKNLLGVIHPPQQVLCDLSFLASLPEREYLAGLAEVVKIAVATDLDLFVWLEQQVAGLLQRDPDILTKLVHWAVALKINLVEQDERDTGIRRKLNLGHTFGHALEKMTAFSDLLHGEAVALGMGLACRLSSVSGRLPQQSTDRVHQLLLKLRLPVTAPHSVSPDDWLQGLLLDKKQSRHGVTLILPTAIGAVDIVTLDAQTLRSLLAHEQSISALA